VTQKTRSNQLFQGNQSKELISYIDNTHGKKFQLELSDGTLSKHLNGEVSSLRYPVIFLSEGPRQVFFPVEAYFDVQKFVSNPLLLMYDELGC